MRKYEEKRRRRGEKKRTIRGENVWCYTSCVVRYFTLWVRFSLLLRCFGVPVFDGYASTEAGSVANNEFIHVGILSLYLSLTLTNNCTGVKVKLENWGEYTADGKEERG
jgi:hypothetical protein